MVVPEHICDAARQGKSRVVMAWLDAAQGSVNDRGMAHAWSSLDAGCPLLSWTCFPHLGFRSLSRRAEITQSHVELARLLLARGADPNWRDRHGDGPLHCACYKTNNNATVEMVSLLIEAGTEFENRRNITNEDTGIVGDYGTETPLSLAMKATLEPQGHAGDLFVSPPAGLRIICMLLRAGASLDTLGSWPARESAEYHLLLALNESSGHFYYSRRLKNDDLQRWQCHFDALWALVAEIRAAGSWKKYVMAPRREFLAIRGLAARGHLATSDPVLDFLVRVDNGVLWNVLSFWGAPEGFRLSRPPLRPPALSFFQRVVGFFTGR